MLNVQPFGEPRGDSAWRIASTPRRSTPSNSSSSTPLQWGRSRPTAERPAQRDCVVQSRRLQWGRSLSTAERAARESARQAAVLLQWGRSLSTAESRRRPSEDDRPRGLQWGRSLSTAESQGLNVFRQRVDAASMGPQSFDCGKDVRVRLGVKKLLLLQWGRSLSTAERSKHQWSGAFVTSFNGAAVFRLRKG